MRRRFFIFPPIILAIAAIMAAVVMLLWNAILPPLLNVGTVSYWQALGLLVLSRLLFGGFHHGWHHRRGSHLLAERWMSLTDEQREHLRQHWHSHCGWSSAPAKEPPQAS